MSILPIELILYICTYLDKDTEHKLKSIMNCKNICCNHNYKITNYLDYKYRKMLYYENDLAKYESTELLEELETLYEKYYNCDACGYYSCYKCNEVIDIFFDECSYCGITFCTKCNNGEKLKEISTLCQKYIDCYYYCSRGICTNSKTQYVCINCVNSLQLHASDTDSSSDTSSINS
jgi:hypothetical protein